MPVFGIVKGLVEVALWIKKFVELNEAIDSELKEIVKLVIVVQGVVESLPHVEGKQWQIVESIHGELLSIKKTLGSVAVARKPFLCPEAQLKSLAGNRTTLLMYFSLLEKTIAINNGIRFNASNFLTHPTASMFWTLHFGSESPEAALTRFLEALQHECGGVVFDEFERGAITKVVDKHGTQVVSVYHFSSLTNEHGLKLGLAKSYEALHPGYPAPLRLAAATPITEYEFTTGDGKPAKFIGESKLNKDGKRIRHGRGIVSYLALKSKHDGYFVEEIAKGPGMYYYADGRVLVGTFTSTLSGSGTITYPDGRLYVGEFKDRLPHGKGLMTYTNGRRYEGDFVKGQYEGQGEFLSSNGAIFKATYKAGKPVQGTLIYPTSNNVYTGGFDTNWKLSGPGKVSFVARGSTLEATFEAGQPIGQALMTYQTGTTLRGTLSNFKLNGETEINTFDGVSICGFFKNRSSEEKYSTGVCENVVIKCKEDKGIAYSGPYVAETGVFNFVGLNMAFGRVDGSREMTDTAKELVASGKLSETDAGDQSATGAEGSVESETGGAADGQQTGQSEEFVEAQEDKPPATPTAAEVPPSAPPAAAPAAPASVQDWLVQHNLGEYWPNFEQAGYDDFVVIVDLKEQELKEEIGIEKPGHRKKLIKLLADLKI